MFLINEQGTKAYNIDKIESIKVDMTSDSYGIFIVTETNDKDCIYQYKTKEEAMKAFKEFIDKYGVRLKDFSGLSSETLV